VRYEKTHPTVRRCCFHKSRCWSAGPNEAVPSRRHASGRSGQSESSDFLSCRRQVYGREWQLRRSVFSSTYVRKWPRRALRSSAAHVSYGLRSGRSRSTCLYSLSTHCSHQPFSEADTRRSTSGQIFGPELFELCGCHLRFELCLQRPIPCVSRQRNGVKGVARNGGGRQV
jgi:hypothetical protein